MKILPEFVKALVAATAGLGVVAILAVAGGALSERMLAMGGDNYGLNGMPGMTLGTARRWTDV